MGGFDSTRDRCNSRLYSCYLVERTTLPQEKKKACRTSCTQRVQSPSAPAGTYSVQRTPREVCVEGNSKGTVGETTIHMPISAAGIVADVILPSS